MPSTVVCHGLAAGTVYAPNRSQPEKADWWPLTGSRCVPSLSETARSRVQKENTPSPSE